MGFPCSSASVCVCVGACINESVIGLMKYRIVTHTPTRTHAADWERKCCIADKPNQNWRKVFVDAQQQQQHSVWPKSSGQCSAPASSRMTDSIRAGHLMRIELCARVHQDLLTSNSEYVNWAQHTCDRKFSLRPRPISMAARGRGRRPYTYHSNYH